MKNYLFIIILALLPTFLFGQENQELPHSTIHIVRSGNFVGSACQSNIFLPNQRRIFLSLKSVIKYKIYSEGEIPVTIDIGCPATTYTPPTTTSKQVVLNVKRGNEYYVFFNGSKFEEVEKERVQKFLDKSKNIMTQAENLLDPINSSAKEVNKKSGKKQGTCFLVSSEGYFVTNFHCIEKAKEITIRGIDGDYTTKYGVTVIASDPSNDLALIKVSNPNVKFTNPPFSIRSSGVAQAEKVYALGFPMAESMGEEMKITEGIISAKSGFQGDISKFQISASVNAGNSGGPLIDEEGNLIGVIYAKSSVAESAGYAVKSAYLETFLKTVESFTFPTLTNIIKEDSLPVKVEKLKNYIFILEAN